MHRSNSHVAVCLTAALLFFASSCYAQMSFNFGFDLGPGELDVNTKAFDDGSLGNTTTIDNDILAMNIYGEMVVNPYLRMELGLFSTSWAEMNAFSDNSGYWWWGGPVSAEYGLAGLKVGAVGTIPLDQQRRFTLLAKLGLALWGSTVILEDRWGDETDSDSGVSPYLGIGAEFAISDLIALRLQHEALSAKAHNEFFVRDYEFDYAASTLGLVFRF